MLMSSSKLFRSSNNGHLNSGVTLLELYCVIFIKHVAFFTICAKLLVTKAFTFTFLDVIVVSDLAKKRHGSADLHTPIHPPHYLSPYRPYLHKDRYTICAVLRPSVARPTLKIFKLIGVSSLSIEIDLMKLKIKR